MPKLLGLLIGGLWRLGLEWKMVEKPQLRECSQLFTLIGQPDE